MTTAHRMKAGGAGRTLHFMPPSPGRRAPVKASSPSVSRRMQLQASRDTAPERKLRSALHRSGLRFRVHVRPLPGVRREADIVFPKARVAVFVDGCFWHGCPDHAPWPKANAAWWREKIE